MNATDLLRDNRRIPLIGNFELTRKCPLNCLICYNERKKKRELNTKEVLDILDQLAEAGCLHINFTGGDPLIREDFPAIYNYAINLGMIPSVESELVYLSDSAKKVMVDTPPHILNVSVYAVDDVYFRLVTRTDISATKVLHNIKELYNAGVPIRVRTPITKLNISQAGQIARFCRELGVPYKPTTQIFWTQSGVRRDDFRCTPECILLNNDGDPIYEYLLKMTRKLWEGPIVKCSCDTGISDFNISAYGELNFCITFWKPEYDLLNGSFKDAWENWYPLFRRAEDNYCLGKVLFGDGKDCPWGLLYSDPDVDTAKSLIEHARDKICLMQNSGIPMSQIKKALGLSDKSLAIIMDENTS